MQSFIRTLLVFLLLATSAIAETEVEYILDFSTSMSGKVDGNLKYKLELESLKQALTKLPNDSTVSIRVFGNKFSQRSKEKSCKDTSLLLKNLSPIQALKNLEEIKIRPKGYTPLAYALSEASKDFKKDDNAKLLILFSDGVDTCGGDPEEVIKELHKQGIEVRVFIASSTKIKRDNEELSRLAKMSGGEFVELAKLDLSFNALSELTSSALNKIVSEGARPGDANGGFDAGDFPLKPLLISAQNYEKNFIGADDKKDYFKLPASVGERYQLSLEISDNAAKKCSVKVLDKDGSLHEEAKLEAAKFETDIFTTAEETYLIEVSCDLPSFEPYSFNLLKIRSF